MKLKISFWLLFLLSLATLTPVDVLAVITSALIHEGGHMLALKAMGGKVTEITASLKGIEFKMDKRGIFKRHEIILINMAGPLAGLLTALTAFFIGNNYLVGVNLALSLFNLLPFEGTDGGEILRQIKNTAEDKSAASKNFKF